MRVLHRPPGFALCAALLVVNLCACAQVPELDAVISDSLKDADFPDLVPIETLVPARVPDPATDSQEQVQQLESRRQALQARAQQLNGTIVDQETRTRMRKGISE
ncbi:hypothetical protein I5535_07250 [Rhodobacteraceae bacterium F11138]|nr:hypothetical protein [Rhodobacteraceae bacterium F11138]